MRAHSSSARSRLVAVSLGFATLLVGACASVLGLEEGILGDPFGDPEGGTSPTNADCVGAGCPCGENNACRDSRYALCLDGGCVECNPADDTCPVGHYCAAATNACAPGCRSNADCDASAPAAPLCNVERHQCVACLKNEDCKEPNQACTPSGTCADKCRMDGGVDGGAGGCGDAGTKTCCDGLCVDTQTDIFNCGGCNAGPCTGASPKCCDGVCKDTASDPNHCGACGTSCATQLQNVVAPSCSAGKCTYERCTPGFANCDSDAGNGCECACGGNDQPCCPLPSPCSSDLVCWFGKCRGCKLPGWRCSSATECCSGRCDQGGYGHPECRW